MRYMFWLITVEPIEIRVIPWEVYRTKAGYSPSISVIQNKIEGQWSFLLVTNDLYIGMSDNLTVKLHIRSALRFIESIYRKYFLLPEKTMFCMTP